MILRVITTLVFAVFLGIGALGAGRYTYIKLGLLMEERRRKQLAAKNMEAATAELCRACEKKIDPKVDFYDKNRDAWWHKKCYQKLID